MTKSQKGKCFLCQQSWYWCKECGASGCPTESCTNQRFEAGGGGLFSFSSIRCKVCGSK